MDDNKKNNNTDKATAETATDLATLDQLDLKSLNTESLDLINKIIAENDQSKTKDLTYLFNNNQKKKTMVRVSKLNDLLDILTNQAITRFTEKPDEISNQELINGIKTINDLVTGGQKQIMGEVEDTPLIQVNNQTNEVNIGNESPTGNLNRDSREKVKAAVLSILKSAGMTAADPVDAEVIVNKEDTKNDK